MIEFTTREKLTITGRGLLIIPCEGHDDPAVMLQKEVLIDGELYLVRGVERTSPRREGDPFGLLVRKISER